MHICQKENHRKNQFLEIVKIKAMNISPVRHHALRPMSKDHDQSLKLCFRIREGLQEDIELSRIKDYTDWFQMNYLEPHFKLEEECIFPVLGKNNVRVKKALANHRRILRLFNRDSDLEKTLNLIEEELGTYIRFEERILYNEIQKAASPQQLAAIERCHQQLRFDDKDWEDRFWRK